MDPQQLRAVIAAARAGREEAYRCLLARFGPRLYGYFFRATGSHHDAEDLLGEMMLRLVRSLRRYDDRGRFEPWLFSIAANLVRDRIRRARASPQAATLDADGGEGPSLGETLKGAERPVDEGLLRDEAGRAVNEALARLRSILVHECTHAFLYYWLRPGRTPLWLHEGTAVHMQAVADPKDADSGILPRDPAG